jgi:hypothetical protein
MRALAENVELVPVLEFEPFACAPDEQAPSSGDPEAWHQHWQKCLALAGLGTLEPVEPGSWFVALPSLTDWTILLRVLQVHLREVNPNSLEQVEAFLQLRGGYALREGGTVLFQPGCCCDFGNLNDWRGAATYRGAEWTMLWIGHPWVSVRFEDGALVLSEQHEGERPPTDGLYRLAPDLLSEAIDRAEAEVLRFAERVLPALASLTPSPVDQAVVLGMLGWV